MDFYESMLYGFYEQLRASAAPGKDEAVKILAAMMNNAACQALEEIRKVLKDESLDDPECFWRIEAIVQIFEDVGSECGGRHDF